MSTTVVAKRYASAMLELAREKGLDEQVGDELRDFAAVLEASPDLNQVLANPAIRRDERIKVVEAIVDKGGLSQITSNFLRLCVDKGRAAIIGDAVRHYEDLLDEQHNRARATVTSSKPLSESDLSALKDRLEAVTGKTVIITTDTDPSLLGGVVTRVGSMVFDSSVKGRLNALKDSLIRDVSY